ncbi:hypothetical protein RUR49_19450 [Pseudoxanthobacter sp. M-2]|uniref:hypothetical protein n=1 Tax=Pseudoxanthobacter sp. M-2 TaxID=3078754 RepID=UPI0038FC286F
MARLQIDPMQGHPVPYVGEPVNDLAFLAWVAQANVGETFVYHRGFLGIDIGPGISRFGEPDRQRLLGLAQAALSAFEADLVHLVQLRLEPDRFAYLAVARRKPAHAPAALARLVAASGQPDLAAAA